MRQSALALLPGVSDGCGGIFVAGAAPDRAGVIAAELARRHERVRVIHHPANLGYGAAVRSGLAASVFEYVCFTDGDDQYEVNDFVKLLKLRDRYDLIITFRYKKIYSSTRLFISWFYNNLLRFLFRTPFRDVSTGLRMVRRSILSDIELEARSPFIGAELAIKAVLHGYRVGEVGIQTFPRTFGQGSSTSVRNIVATIADMCRIYRKIFSAAYDLPPGRPRGGGARGAS